MMRILFRDIFWVHGRGEHYEICLAETLREAEGFIGDPKTRPDVAVFGLQTPAEKGLLGTSSQMKETVEYIKKLKANPELSAMKILIFSGHNDPDFKEKMLSLGVSGYLVKGELMPKEIISFVDSTVHGSHQNLNV